MERKTLSPSVLMALGITGAASQAAKCGPCLDIAVESDTDTDTNTDTDSDTDTDADSDSDSESDTDTGPCLDIAPEYRSAQPPMGFEPGSAVGADVVNRVIERGVLPDDVAVRLRARKNR